MQNIFVNNIQKYNQNLTIEEYNQLASFVSSTQTQELSKLIPQYNESEYTITNELINNILSLYIQILERCQFITHQNNKDSINPELIKFCKENIPITIYKSIQIIINYEQQFKITSCLLFCFIIPICYVSDLKANAIITTPNQQDIHLTFGINQLSIHQHTFNSHALNQIIHHINANEFDNRKDNLVSITVSKEEIAYFNQNCDWISSYTPFVKHQQLHRFLNNEYSLQAPLYFENCIDLTSFNLENSFYKRHIQNHLNDPEKSLYEFENSGAANFDFDMKQFIKFINSIII
ncbi:Hypothetical_protein [Hexamita inflata]|uniref:Hypothetical_protein n=1 Tax=Hexamita inflata TaxID=28002 RepID=A0AA86NTD8_9EUKA|nr:Hypothetical protein HINF_LOCUS13360 [Hexamita inflata]